jgi:putative ABC transport system permease protein
MLNLLRDLKYAVRTLGKNYGFTAVASLMLAFGLGLVIFMFCAIKGLFLTQLPFERPEQLLHVEYQNPKTQQFSLEVNWYDYLEMAQRQRSFEALAAWSGGTINMSADDVPERYDGVFISANGFEVLGVEPVLGRGFLPGEDLAGAPLPVLIGDNLWRNRFDADPGVVGKLVRVNGREATIVGVMGPGFKFPINNNIWIPQQRPVGEKRTETITVEVYGRVKDGVSLADARGDIAAITAQLARDFPETNQDLEPVVKPYKDEFVGNQTKRIVGTMFAAVVLVLLIACANVANLILARSTDRTRELAVRTALGASRWQIVRAMLAEALVIAFIGAGIGLLLAQIGVEALVRALIASEDPPPYFVDFSLDWRVGVFAFGIAVLTAFVAGLLPALRASRLDVHDVIKDAGRGSAGRGLTRLTRILVIGEIALSCVLLVSAGLTVRSTLKANDIDLGVKSEGILTGRLALFETAYPSPESRQRMYEQLLARLAEVPGAEQVAITQSLPVSFYNGTVVLPAGEPEPARNSDQVGSGNIAVTPSFIDVFQVPLRDGRNLNDGDRIDTLPVALVNERFVAEVLKGRPAVGAQVRVGPKDDDATQMVTIVGVVGDVIHDSDLEDGVRPMLYRPLTQADPRYFSFAVKGAGDPLALAAPVRAAVKAVDRDLPIYWLRTLDDWMQLALFDHRLIGALFGTFALFALLLAAAGIYAVLAFAVGTRTREIGVRRALGAQDRGILRMVLSQGGVQLALGLGIGMVLAMGFAQALGSFLLDVSTFDPPTYLVVLAALTAVTALACTLPALRALRVDPMVALRYE